MIMFSIDQKRTEKKTDPEDKDRTEYTAKRLFIRKRYTRDAPALEK